MVAPSRTALYCATCNVLCSSTKALKDHLEGRKHKKNLRQGENPLYRSAPVRCSLCDRVVVGGERSWNTHIEGRNHKHQASLIPNHVELNFLQALEIVQDGKRRCASCLTAVEKSDWDAHLRTTRHKYAVQLTSVREAVQEAEQDKYGITVSHRDGVDMGLLEVGDLTTTAIAGTSLDVTATDQALKFIGCRTATSSISRATPHFFFGNVPSQIVPLGSTISIPLTFNPDGLRGRFQDRIELVFENTILSQEFTIMRLVNGVVGVQAELEAMKPAAPFVARERITLDPESEIVKGEPPPALKAIPWKVKLLEYPLPGRIIGSSFIRGLEGKVTRIQEMLPNPWTAETYGKLWSTLLFVEEAQMKKDIQFYDMKDVTLDQNGKYYHLDVPGLAEKRPSVLVGDTIKIHIQGSTPEERWYEGFVHYVRQRHVGLCFARNFRYTKGQLCQVRFEISRIPLRRMHQAMDRPFLSDRVLFPTAEHAAHIVPPTQEQMEAVRAVLVNPLIKQNDPQLLAITTIRDAAPGSLPFVIWGPPGTGKTVTMVESIRQVLLKNPSARIIACAPSNSAADWIVEQLKDLTTRRLFRLVAPSREKDLVEDVVFPFCYMREVTQNGVTRQVFSVPPLPVLKRYNVIVSTCVQSSVPHGIGFPRGHFSHIFVDEAGQGLEPEVMIPIMTMAGPETNIILSGDPKQLGPIIHSNVAKELNFGLSYLERLLDQKVYHHKRYRGISVVKLVKNYRSHPAILEFPNEVFYNGELEACGSLDRINRLTQWSGLPKKGFPVIFHALRGQDAQEASSPSYFNPDEASAVREYIKRLRDDRSLRLADSDIGVISPYNKQCRKIRANLNGQHEYIKVDSTEGFQGQERPVIIISTVRSQPGLIAQDAEYALGFVAQPRRLNVAITRAQALLIVIGDPMVLRCDPLWKSFMSYVYQGGGWIGDRPIWDTKELLTVPVDRMEELEDKVKEETLANAPSKDGEDEDSEDGDRGEDAAQADRPWRRDGEE